MRCSGASSITALFDRSAVRSPDTGALLPGNRAGRPRSHAGLRYDDPFLVLADYESYIECQGRVSAAWQDSDAWTRMSILNTARSGKFSSDSAIAEYCDQIWNVQPVTVKVDR